MKITVGTDIIEVERIKNAIESNKKFLETVFTDKEIEYCENKKKSKYEHYAARFAAKEAVFKAVSIYLKDKYSMSWKNVEILNDENGRPYINLIDINIKYENVDVSLSHIKDYAIASVVVSIQNEE